MAKKHGPAAAAGDKDDSHRDIKRKKDLQTISNLFSVFPRPLVEYVLQEALYDRIHVDHIDCLGAAEKRFFSTLFHLYDSRLRQLLEKFFEHWNLAWEVGRMSHHDPLHRGLATLSLSETDPSGWDDYDKYVEHVKQALRRMSDLTRHLHEEFPEFDVPDSDQRAEDEYWQMVERVEKRANELWGDSKSSAGAPEADATSELSPQTNQSNELRDSTMDEDHARECLSKVEKLKEMLVSRATGGTPDEQEFVQLRRELVANLAIRNAMPEFVKKCSTIREFWNFIKPMFETDKYRQRTEFLQREFMPILDALEGKRPLPDLTHSPAQTPSPKVPPRPDLLLVTVNEHETQAVLNAFQEITQHDPVAVTLGGRVYHDLGTVNETRVFHAISEMGSGGAGGMQQTVDKAIRALEPAAIAAVGVAFGLDEERQAIGDVLLSKQLRLYELQRVGHDKIVLRGARPDASSRLLNHFKVFGYAKWHRSKFRSGVMLSGEKLVDNVDYRVQLKALESEAIGGEMEGAGLYVSGTDHKVDWIVLKAICDFADGAKGKDKDERQILAAKNAVDFVISALQHAPLKRNG